MSKALWDFVRESNRIEGIHREPTEREVQATEDFLGLDKISILDLCALVAVYSPGADLRVHEGMDVRVGRHYPPRGGEHIREALQGILIALPHMTPYRAHVAYEKLHPFMDGNGRSGRALWLWMMRNEAPLGFLHHFYYQALSEAPDVR